MIKDNKTGKIRQIKKPRVEPNGINQHYLSLADGFKWAKWLLLVVLILFVLIELILNSKQITLDNISYLLRYIDIQNSTNPSKSEFPAEFDDASSVCYYRNNIVVLERTKIGIYDVNGRKNYNQTLTYSNPVLDASNQYILTYDLGANKLDIFNSFSQVYQYTGDTPVYNAKITDKGNVVYVTTEPGYKSAVKVMDSGFNEIYRCFFYKDYIVDADIDDNAKNLVTAGFSAANGDYVSTITMYQTNSEEVKKTISVVGEQPYGVKLNLNGFCAVLENEIKFYNTDGDEVSSYNFAYRKIQSMLLTANYSAVVLNEKTLGSDSRILIFDASGNVLYDNVVSSEIMDIKFSEDNNFLYFLARTGLYKVDIKQKIFELVTNQYDDTTDCIVYANDKNIFLSGLVKINIIKADVRQNTDSTDNTDS
ncbi:MAG: DUF5711 family protein [Oscillospiraceae bacterium]|nr:DUF5711 family protein [Oscillospiraceae bacterium]